VRSVAIVDPGVHGRPARMDSPDRRPVYIRSAPVDPRDVMRGDYVRLSYDISHVPRELWRAHWRRESPTSTRCRVIPRVYASLQLKERWRCSTVVSRARAASRWPLYPRTNRTSSAGQINVRYGLEALFLEQGKGEELETRRNRNGIQYRWR